MEPILYPSNLGMLSDAQLTQIINSSVEQSIHAINMESQLFNSHKNSPSKISESSQTLLQLRGNFLAEFEPFSNSIMAGFRFDYEIKFEVVPYPLKQEKGKKKQNQNQYVGLTFHFPQPQSHHTSFLVQQTPAFECFLKKLQKKYITQLKFHEKFQPIRKIGKGVTSNVYRACRLKDKKHVAIKSYKKELLTDSEKAFGKQAFLKEIKILTEVKHKNICQFEGIYESPNSSYIVMELLGCSLYSYLQKSGFPSEKKVKMMIQQLLRGLNHLHSKGLMHRDLKLENIMIKSETTEKIEVSIIDLGLAEYVSNEKYLYTRCGTPGYVAPQILKIRSNQDQKYSEACDIFSLGVIFHILLFKKSIFDGKDVKEVIKRNTECQIDKSAEYLKNVSDQTLDLLWKMLEKNPLDRISARQALQHPYLSQLGKQTELMNKETSSKIEIPLE